ncbi:MAG: hypothetical protein AAB766_02890 [Patescibacteria group bacterium]
MSNIFTNAFAVNAMKLNQPPNDYLMTLISATNAVDIMVAAKSELVQFAMKLSLLEKI